MKNKFSNLDRTRSYQGLFIGVGLTIFLKQPNEQVLTVERKSGHALDKGYGNFPQYVRIKEAGILDDGDRVTNKFDMPSYAELQDRLMPHLRLGQESFVK